MTTLRSGESAREVWEQALGSLLSPEQARQKLGGVSAERLEQMVEQGEVIALELRSRELAYPANQFEAGRVLEPLAAMHRALVELSDGSPWTLASMTLDARIRDPQLDGLNPRAWALSGRDRQPLLLVARRDATHMSH